MPATDPLQRNHVSVSGPPGAERTLLFVHGLGTEQSSWQPVASRLAADYRMVLFDNVGAGRADPQAFVQHRYLNLHQYAQDLIEICATLDLQRTTLIGHSAGAMMGALAVLKEPARFERLVMIGASPRYLDDGDYHGGMTTQDLSSVYSTVMNRYSDWIDALVPQAMANPDQPELARYFADTIRAIPRQHLLTVLCSILQSDHRADINALRLPTLLLQTEQDCFVPPQVARYLHQHIAGSQLSIIPAQGHFPHLAAPELVAAAIRDFLAGS